MLGVKLKPLLSGLLVTFLAHSIGESALAGPMDWSQDSGEALMAAGTVESKSESEAPVPEIFKNWELIFKAPSYQPVNWGLNFTGSSPFLLNDTTPQLPASVLKLATAAAALEVLGRNFVFENRLEAQFDAATGELWDLEMVLSGDPTLAHEAYNETIRSRMNLLVTQLVKQGVRAIHGEVRISTTQPMLLNRTRPTDWRPEWVNSCYATLPLVAFVRGNCAQLRITPAGGVTWLTEGVTTPVQVKFTNSVLRVAPVLDSLGQVLRYQITGARPRYDQVYSLPIHQTETWLKNLFFAAVLRAKISRSTSTISKVGERVSYDFSSRPLVEVLPPFMQNSINAVGDRLAIEISSRMGLSTTGLGTVAVLRRMLSDASFDSVVVTDGSGLGLLNQVSPALITRLLQTMKTEDAFQDYLAALAVAGVSGTLIDRLTNGATIGRIIGKTGTLTGQINLAGYYRQADNELIPFAIFGASVIASTQVRFLTDQAVLAWVNDETARK